MNMIENIEPLKSFPDFLDHLQKTGILCFSRRDVTSCIKITDNALNLSLYRQSVKGRIKKIHRDFYIIIPLEYQGVESIPPEWFIDQLMKFKDVKYYVGLLSAASLYGATHQQPMQFQVITEGRHFRDIKIGRTFIHFISKNRIPNIGIDQKKSLTGYFNISTPELTLYDLVRYPSSSGQLNNIATIVAELSETIKPRTLVNIAKMSSSERGEMIYWQRLGYIIDFVGAEKKANFLSQWILQKNASLGYLVHSGKEETLMRDKRWNLYINSKLESDL